MAEVVEIIKKKSQGQTLRVLRTAAYMTQETLADLTKLSTKTIAKYENQEEIPQDKLEIFAKVFDIPVSFFEKFNFEEAIERFTNNFDINDSIKDNGYATTGGVIEEVNNYSESPKFYEMLAARIEDAEIIGGLKKENEMLKKALDQSIGK